MNLIQTGVKFSSTNTAYVAFIDGRILRDGKRNIKFFPTQEAAEKAITVSQKRRYGCR